MNALQCFALELILPFTSANDSAFVQALTLQQLKNAYTEVQKE